MVGLFFVLGAVTGACILLPIVHMSAYSDGYREGTRMRHKLKDKTYLRRVADLLDVTTEGEDAAEVVQWAMQKADKDTPND